ncbi:MAG: dephospho-CoA kinase [Bacteroidetes bacterium]|nr:dephospho-CoA kinase [Bacteroidota bacterium]
MIIIGVTGGIGSGKTTFCNYFSKLGIPVIIADEVGHFVLANNYNVRFQIIRYFGASVLTPENKINKNYLADIVFKNKLKLKKLNEIVHSAVIHQVRKKIKSLSLTNKLVLIESAILPKTQLIKYCDFIISIMLDKNIRFERKLKNQFSKEELINRSKNQPKDSEYEQISDFIIINNKSLKDLKNISKFYFELFKKIAKN